MIKIGGRLRRQDPNGVTVLPARQKPGIQSFFRAPRALQQNNFGAPSIKTIEAPASIGTIFGLPGAPIPSLSSLWDPESDYGQRTTGRTI